MENDEKYLSHHECFKIKPHNYIILKIKIQKVKNALNACNQNKDNVLYASNYSFFIVNILIFYYIEEKSFTLSKCIPSRTSKTSLIISSATNFTLKIFHEKFNDFATIKILIRQSMKTFRISSNSLNNHIFPQTIVQISNYPGSNFMFCKYKHLSSSIFLKQH